MAEEKSADTLSAEHRVQLSVIRTHGVTTSLTHALWAGTVAFFGWCLYRIAIVWAGDHTVADIGIRVFSDIRFSATLPWAFGAGGVLYGLRQKHLRKNAVERLARRARDLEQRLDSQRSTSGLTPRGDTPS